MKGLILSGGKGTRLYPLTYTRAKQLMPVANKPVLFRVIEAIRDAGITEIGIVIGDSGPEIREAVKDGSKFGNVHITYIPQEQPLGLAHAVKISQSFLGDDRFVMFLGDNVIQGGISPLIADFATHPEWNSQIVLTRVQNPQAYGVATLTPDGKIRRLVEKPQEPESDLALVGIYMFDARIWDAVHAIQPSRRGELEITDAIQWQVDHGCEVFPHVHTGWWIDTGKPIDMLDANCRVLEELTPVILGHVDAQSRVDSRVTIEAGAEIINSVIRGPAIIGEGTRIINSFIGPFTSIYHHSTVENCEIEHSIILEESTLKDVQARIVDSLIGRKVELYRAPRMPNGINLTLGDHSRVGLE
jgi:glucose-1-phosphate thymidylyltransferase